ncbi:hypothetical protein BCR34DRAFT_599624 [Clohesyomyces aquaticus]|uniref:Uncharacterized protein n=1 Tax=Clohesyomyces aquaticus TaxID=1231657 RepID=A0A1Y1ZUG7_9PLEO|nr:hypothetical protein BCR34DRAFT_599624 [Clohesyomyces aquaticus]
MASPTTSLLDQEVNDTNLPPYPPLPTTVDDALNDPSPPPSYPEQHVPESPRTDKPLPESNALDGSQASIDFDVIEKETEAARKDSPAIESCINATAIFFDKLKHSNNTTLHRDTRSSYYAELRLKEELETIKAQLELQFNRALSNELGAAIEEDTALEEDLNEMNGPLDP